MYLVPFSAHPGHSRLTQVGYIRRCQAPTLRNRSRGGEATRLKNQGPGFEPGPRCYFSCSAETSESHASYITPRRALLRTRTFAPPAFDAIYGRYDSYPLSGLLRRRRGGRVRMAPGTVFRPFRLGSIDSGGPYSPVPGTDGFYKAGGDAGKGSGIPSGSSSCIFRGDRRILTHDLRSASARVCGLTYASNAI